MGRNASVRSSSAAHAVTALLLLLALSVLAVAPGLAQSPSPPPPTPVPVPGGSTSPSPFPSVLHTPPPTAIQPELRAASAVLVDLDSGRTLFGLDAAERRPVASLTKIMTAYLVLQETSPDDVVTVSANAASGTVVGISTLGLIEGETLRVEDLLYALMLQSANDAAVALAEHVAGDVDTFVDLMNRTASRLGMSRTSFASPNGLDDAGYSTARDLAKLTRAAYGISGFATVVAARTHAIPSPDGDPRIVQNRNALLWLYPGATGVKTGFTTPAGFCMVAAAERGDEHLLAVVLGEPSEPFSDAATLLDHGFTAYERGLLIQDGRDLGTVAIDGRDVGVVAGAGLEGLMPAGARIRREVVVDPRVRFPPGRGQQIGSVVLSVPGWPSLGQVPLVVAEVPPPPTLPDPGSWWSRSLGAVVDAGAGLLEALFS